MYELLKQYEYAGAREISVKDLRDFLGVGPKEYPRWDNFKRRVLDGPQAALKDYTDIQFDWEVVGKRGRGGRAYHLKFTVRPNNNHLPEISMDDFLLAQTEPLRKGEPQEFERTDLDVDIRDTGTDRDIGPDAADGDNGGAAAGDPKGAPETAGGLPEAAAKPKRRATPDAGAKTPRRTKTKRQPETAAGVPDTDIAAEIAPGEPDGGALPEAANDQPTPDAPPEQPAGPQNYVANELYPFLSDACEDEFSVEELQVLYNLAIQIVPSQNSRAAKQIALYDYLKRKHDELNWRASNATITNRMGYIKKIIEADLL
jgi:hypothetical protein